MTRAIPGTRLRSKTEHVSVKMTIMEAKAIYRARWQDMPLKHLAPFLRGLKKIDLAITSATGAA